MFSGAKEPGDANTDGWPQKVIDYVQAGGFEPWPNITEQGEALPGADEAANEENKLGDLDPKPPQ